MLLPERVRSVTEPAPFSPCQRSRAPLRHAARVEHGRFIRAAGARRAQPVNLPHIARGGEHRASPLQQPGRLGFVGLRDQREFAIAGRR